MSTEPWRLFAFQIAEKLLPTSARQYRRPVTEWDLFTNEMRELCLGDQSEASIQVTWPVLTNQRPGQWQWSRRPRDISSELRRRDILFSVTGDKWDEMVTWPCVTSVWHVTRAWHHGDRRHHGRVLCSCWVASDIQSSIRGRYLWKLNSKSKDTPRTLFVWLYEATNNWNARHKLSQIEKSRNSGPYFQADRPSLVRFYGQFSMKMELPQVISPFSPSLPTRILASHLLPPLLNVCWVLSNVVRLAEVCQPIYQPCPNNI